MSIEVLEESIDRLGDHAAVSIAFLVERVLEVSLVDGGLGGITLTEAAIADTWVKDYDEIEPPTRWPERFDVSSWGLLAAYDGAARLGGAVIAFDTPGVDLLGGRSDVAVLWDLRVVPEARGRGIGTRLFRAVEAWARRHSCQAMVVETQNVNLPACRFYARRGCQLVSIDRGAYAALPDETRLLWRRAW